MSDFKFYGLDTVTHVNAGACTFAGTTITTSNDIADLGDMVYFQISETQGAVGVCTNTGTTFNVDTNVYSNIPSSLLLTAQHHLFMYLTKPMICFMMRLLATE